MPPIRRKAAPKPAKKAAKKAPKKSPGLAEYASATVRPYEVGSLTTRYRQSIVAELVLRFAKYVAVAQSRNAMGVASKALRVYRRGMEDNRSTGTGKMWAYETRPLRHKELLRQRQRSGVITRKAAELSDDVEEVIDPAHPLVRLLANPNPLMSGQQFLEQIQLGVGLAGDSYAHMVWNDKPWPVEIWSLAPQFVRPQPSRANMVESYIYGRGTENEKTIPADEMVRFTQPNPRGDPFRGFSDIEKCLDDADLSVAFSQFRLNTLDNGAQPGLILIDKKGGIEQRKQIEAALERKFSGLDKVGRSLVLTGEVEVQNWSMNEKEVSFLNSDAAVRETIANCHDIPVALLTLESAALATAKVALTHWEQIGLKPRCDRISDTLNVSLVPNFGDDRLYVCFEEVVTRDDEATRTSVVALFNADLVTQNEGRAEIGYDAVPGGDKFKSEIAQEQFEANAKLGASLGPATAGGVGGSEPPVDKPGAGKDDEVGDEKPAEKSSPRIGGLNINIISDADRLNGHAKTIDTTGNMDVYTTITGGPKTFTLAPPPVSQRAMIFAAEPITCCPHHPRNMRKDAAIDTITLTERQLEALVRSWFNDLVAPLSAKMTRDGLPPEANKIISESFQRTMTGPLTRIFIHGWNFGVQELGAHRGAATLMASLGEPAAKYLREYEGKMVRSVSDTVDATIREELAQGVEAGESIPQLTNRLKVSVEGMSGVGAERIARTETSRAFQVSRIESWKESGNVWGKRWKKAPDCCEFCEAAAEEYGIQPLDSPFFLKGTVLTGTLGGTMTLDYSDVEAANLHPNDRCDIVLVLEKPK